MQPQQERVVKEKQKLDVKLHKLREFMLTSTFKDLSLKETIRLYRQEMVMEMYSKILGERITAFKEGQ